jgi:hypothetical protein
MKSIINIFFLALIPIIAPAQYAAYFGQPANASAVMEGSETIRFIAAPAKAAHLKIGGFFLKETPRDFYVKLGGVDSVIFTPPSELSLNKLTVTSTQDTISVEYLPNADTFGIRDMKIPVAIWRKGQAQNTEIEIKTFDNWWSNTVLNYTPNITISSIAEAEALRDTIRAWFYPGGWPTTGPDSIVTNYGSDALVNPNLTNLLRVDLHFYNYHIWSTKVYRLVPLVPNGKAAILNLGHFTTWTNSGSSSTVSERLLQAGYEVFYADMPLGGGVNHNAMGTESGTVNVLTAFIDQYIRSMNYIESTLGITTAIATGVSTGGWLTMLNMAVDTRITAGIGLSPQTPCPLIAQSTPNTPDIEQSCTINQAPGSKNLYRDIATIEDIMILAGLGGRPATLGFNPYDSCCWRKKVSDQFEAIEHVARSLGSQFKVDLYYPGAVHSYGVIGVNSILNFIK